jgi:hypothetical protein
MGVASLAQALSAIENECLSETAELAVDHTVARALLRSTHVCGHGDDTM